MKSRPGRTAFFSTSQLWGLLSEEEKMMVECSWVEYWPFPYRWMQRCRGRANGLGLESAGLEMEVEELGEFEEGKVKRLVLFVSFSLSFFFPVSRSS